MKRSYNLLVHKSFNQAVAETVARFPKIEKPLTTALGQIKSNPTFGNMMRDIANPRLQGVIRKVHVGGRKGHRLVYIHPLKSDLVVPVFLSPDPKPPFEYDSVDWEALSDEIADDIENKRYEKFENWSP